MIVLDQVQAALPSLSPAERRVGKLCLGDPKTFTRLPVGSLADLSHVSKPTVVRFCRSVGYRGLTDFKTQLSSSFAEGVPFIHRSVKGDDSTQEVLAKVAANAAAAILKYADDTKATALGSAVDTMMRAYECQERIQFMGVGTSGLVAQDAQTKFLRLGVHSTAFADGHMQMMAASTLRAGDCVVAISNSGRSRDLLEACDVARSNGASIIVISASNSPLAALGSVHIAVDHPESFDMYSPMVSRLLHLLVVDALATCMALRIGPEKLQPMLRRMKANLRVKRFA